MTNFLPLLSVGGFEVYFGIYELSTNLHFRIKKSLSTLMMMVGKMMMMVETMMMMVGTMSGGG